MAASEQACMYGRIHTSPGSAGLAQARPNNCIPTSTSDPGVDRILGMHSQHTDTVLHMEYGDKLRSCNFPASPL